jgi:hypothetical protein
MLNAKSIEECKKVGVDHVKRSVGLGLFDDARNVDLAGTLRDHLNVDAVLTENTKEAAADADHATQLATDKTNDGKTRDKVDITPNTEVVDGTLEGSRLDLNLFRVGTGTRQERNFGVQSHGHMDFGRRDEVDRQMPLIENREDGHEEAVGTRALLRVHVEHGNTALDGDSGGTLGSVVGAETDQTAVAEERRLLLAKIGCIGPDHGTLVARVLDVLDADRNAGLDDLVHGEGVDDFRSIEGQFGSLGWGDRGQQTSGRYLARVCSEDTIDLLPDLQFRGANADSNQGGAKVGVATSNLSKETARDVAEVASNDGNGIAAGVDSSCKRLGQVAVERVVNAFADVEVDDIAQIDVFGVATTVLEDGSHVQTRQLLALCDNLVLGTLADLGQVLGRLEDLDQRVAFGIDGIRVGFQDVGRGDGVLANDDVVGADDIDNVDVFARTTAFGLAGGAQQTIGGALALGVGAASRAHDGGAVFLQASTGGGLVLGWMQCVQERSAYMTMSLAMSMANLPTLVPPNFCTTQLPPPGRFFSCW